MIDDNFIISPASPSRHRVTGEQKGETDHLIVKGILGREKRTSKLCSPSLTSVSVSRSKKLDFRLPLRTRQPACLFLFNGDKSTEATPHKATGLCAFPFRSLLPPHIHTHTQHLPCKQHIVQGHLLKLSTDPPSPFPPPGLHVPLPSSAVFSTLKC